MRALTWRAWTAIVCALLVSACALLTSLDDLHGDAGSDASADVTSLDVAAADAASDTKGTDAVDTDAFLGCPDASEDALEVYLRFNEGIGTTVADCSGHGRNGTIINPKPANGSWTTGHTGSGIEVVNDGGTGCVDVVLFPSLTGALTIASWVRIDADPPAATATVIVAKQFDNGSGWRSSLSAVGQYSFTLGGPGDGGMFQLAVAKPIVFGEWHHVAGVFQPDTSFLLYLDGVQVGMRTNPPDASFDTLATLRIGCRGDTAPATFLDGVVDEVRVYSRALSGAEVNALYNQ